MEELTGVSKRTHKLILNSLLCVPKTLFVQTAADSGIHLCGGNRGTAALANLLYTLWQHRNDT